MKIERHIWQPNFANEIWITEEPDRKETFTITLKQGADVEIEFDWDHGYGGRGTSRMYIPTQQLKDLLNEIDNHEIL